MNWNSTIRQLHRWLSILFTLVVAAIFMTLGLGREPVQWVYYLPLGPLALMTATGLWMFFLPYVVRARRVKGSQDRSGAATISADRIQR